MTVLLFLLACGVGAAIGLADRPSSRIGRLAGLASLAVAFVAALLIGSTTRTTVGDVTFAGASTPASSSPVRPARLCFFA